METQCVLGFYCDSYKAKWWQITEHAKWGGNKYDRKGYDD